jgi:hypothetical protein
LLSDRNAWAAAAVPPGLAFFSWPDAKSLRRKNEVGRKERCAIPGVYAAKEALRSSSWLCVN